jgi:hypothetical protein
MLVRSAGFVVEAKILTLDEVVGLRHKNFDGNVGVANQTLKEIVESKANTPDESFAVSGYPPKATHAYWFIDGAIRMGLDLQKETWREIARWACNEFHRQVIYVSAGNDAVMDPPSLAMAACLISLIRRFTEKRPDLTDVTRILPSTVELDFGIQQVFSKQTESGIWHRYFPLFHFPKGQGAADYCFSFEFLEAMLLEFGASVLRDIRLLERVKKAIAWCDRHELLFADSTGTYRGWNSGGEVRKLEAGMSESWATASVHMFLTQLHRQINDLLDELVLKHFGLDRRAVSPSSKKFNELIDVEVKFPGERPTTLKDVVREEILEKAIKLDTEQLVRNGLPVPRSILLFGPPGTSKSRLAKAIAEYLGWPLVVVTPSEFLGKGLEQVHAEVSERFKDLMDLRKTVVFFDEMDALAQTREVDEVSTGASAPNINDVQPAVGRTGEQLDVTRQLLTTSMLPKLSNLWDQKHVILLMATNHKQHLDPAITRPNRFDLLLCVAPPPWISKRTAENLENILKIPNSKRVEGELRRLVPDGSATAKRLDLFTVAEVGIFLDHLRRQKNHPNALDALKQFKDPSQFERLVEDWAVSSITLRTNSRALAEFEKDATGSQRQYYPAE